MSGYKGDTNPSKLGGGVKGGFKSGFGNTMSGSEVAMNRRKLRKAFKTNKVSANGQTFSSSAGPFRTAFNLGDPLGRKNFSCGGSRQSNKDGVSNQDCNKSVNGFTTQDVPLAGNNNTFVSDSSLYTKFKHLKSVNLTYNDKSAGGDEHNASFSDTNRVRQS